MSKIIRIMNNDDCLGFDMVWVMTVLMMMMMMMMLLIDDDDDDDDDGDDGQKGQMRWSGTRSN